MSSERTARPHTCPVTDSVLDGRYRLTRRAGRGGMADVWAAEDLLLGRRVAVKVFRFDTPGADSERVELEMRTLAQLSHAGIVTVHDAGMAGEQADGPAYLVMEFVDGQSLAQRLASGPMGAADVALLGRQLAETLTYLHGRGVVHRDIKPANVLLQAAADGPECIRARLTDFGVARLLDSSRITSVGTTVGTANYLSPEQATGAEVGPPADVYALGLVLLECLTGQVAYPGSGVEAAVARLHRPPHMPAAIGDEWVRLLSAMTANDPAARPSAAEVDAEIARLLIHDPGHPRARTCALSEQSSSPPGGTRILAAAAGTEPPAAVPPRRAWWSRPLVWVGAVVAVAAAVAATLAVTLTQGGGSSAQPHPSPRPTTTQQPSYPDVPGQLGQDLRKLEEAVG